MPRATTSARKVRTNLSAVGRETSKLPGVVGVFRGLRHRNGKLTDEPVISVHVARKRKKSELAKEDRLGERFPDVAIDIVPVGRPRLHAEVDSDDQLVAAYDPLERASAVSALAKRGQEVQSRSHGQGEPRDPRAHRLSQAVRYVTTCGPNWQNIVFTPAATGTNGNVTSAPYGSYTNNNNGQCYDWWYPSAWDSSGNSDQYDYAAVDFRRCGNPTINNTGWMGTYVNQNSFPSTHLDGYPASYNVNNNEPSSPGSTPPCGRNNNPSGFYPFLCGMSGPANIQPNKSYAVESDTLNSSDGMSGGPWWFWLNGNDPRVQGVTHGWENYFDFTQCGFNNCNRNYAHLIDTAYWNFLTQVTEL